MSILIKNMKMPKNCGECPFASPTRDGLKCDAVNFLAKCLVHPVTRMSCCPLIELPLHGRLIDADAATKQGWTINRTYSASPNEMVYEVKTMNDEVLPTIIPADESDMDSFIRIFEEDDEEDGMDSFIRILKD